MPLVRLSELEKAVDAALHRLGYADTDAHTIRDVLLYGACDCRVDRMGAPSH
jgi:hypothetical protein